jgi:hypothetical protein
VGLDGLFLVGVIRLIIIFNGSAYFSGGFFSIFCGIFVFIEQLEFFPLLWLVVANCLNYSDVLLYSLAISF